MFERDEEAPLLLLTNDCIVVGILPRIGGRIVLLRAPEGPNVLLSDPACWSDEPVPAADAEFIPYNGHITWVGPQSGWWADQDVNPARREAGAAWPPDPWLIYGEYRVEKRTSTSVRLVGPDSPVCGLRMTKEVGLGEGGTVVVNVTAQNIRDRPVTWDIWSNTRLPGRCTVLTHAGAEGSCRVEQGKTPLPYQIVAGAFTFDVTAPVPEGEASMSAKAFIDSPTGFLGAVNGDHFFVKRTGRRSRAQVHPEQAFVEVYQSVARAPDPGLLELEFHSALRTLAPGESMSFSETWQLTDNC